MATTQTLIPPRAGAQPEPRPQKLLLGRAQQEIKSAVHRELLTRIDLRMARFGHVVVKRRREWIVGALRSPRRFRNSSRLLAEDQEAMREERE